MSHIINNDKNTPHIKRLIEQYVGDADFRQNYPMGQRFPHESIKDTDCESTRPLWDPDYIQPEDYMEPESVKKFKAFNQSKVTWRNQVRETCAPTNTRFKKWRLRQMQRSTLQLGSYLNDRLIHTPIMFELAEGCSVGCSFCALGAEKLTNVFPYSDGNQQLWRNMLAIVKKHIGPAAHYGTCYFATEPLDNPDYEKFCLDFADILGSFPQTTTAIPTRDIQRTRKLIQLSRKHGCDIDRFSVLSLGTLYKIFDNFTPEELVYVELILQNNESVLTKSASGKYLDIIQKDAELKAKAESNQMGKSISCLTGFMVNMCTKTCKLIAPCPANEEWPYGYMVYGETSFETAEDFEDVLLDFMDNSMKIDVMELPYVKLRKGLSVNKSIKHINIEDSYHKLSLTLSKNGESYMEKLLHYLANASHSAKTIAMLLYYEYQVDEQTTLNTLNYLYQQGIFEEMVHDDH